VQDVFKSLAPFFFAHGATDPENAVFFGIFGERHIVGDDFDNPRFRNGVVEFPAEGEILFGRVVGVVKDNERRRLTDDERRLQKALGTLDGIAGIEGGIVRHIAMFQQPAESPLV